MAETKFDNKVNILADLWMNYRDDEDFKDFIEYSDIGIPLAYMISNGITVKTDMGEKFIEETWLLFLAGLGIKDEGYDTLDDILLSIN